MVGTNAAEKKVLDPSLGIMPESSYGYVAGVCFCVRVLFREWLRFSGHSFFGATTRMRF